MESRAPLELTAWHAEPMDPARAEVRRAEQQAYPRGRDCPRSRLQAMIGRFWLGRSIEPDHATLAQVASDAVTRALADLVYGQLLLSRKLAGAHDHLRAGFAAATPHLSAAGYFVLLRRHELLASIPLTEQPSPALGLAELLREAAVIRGLRRQRR
ncbi:MAG: hypothetical protein GWO16_11185 [Gammaproteobacteria bacterium]|nr:hypothetical protein [Gammaproteobacteria bacterium]NIR98397.1 hypothetical protein [Gammaproteobacteria bacterium]NIT64151.1 hypothetical protein [Gammaproteobacteria bacterium]NIV21088.1 hypothetical protein [Gammaproteobacteria bacterium]NIY32731.1 hypothetical protein [Gammaproteobacteria bacterium]